MFCLLSRRHVAALTVLNSSLVTSMFPALLLFPGLSIELTAVLHPTRIHHVHLTVCVVCIYVTQNIYTTKVANDKRVDVVRSLLVLSHWFLPF